MSHFSAASSRWRPFSRSYGAILPSSLTTLLPPALGSSPHPPVSVYGTGTYGTIAAFLDSWPTRFATFVSLPITPLALRGGFAYRAPPALGPVLPSPARVFLLCPHSSVHMQYRNLHLLSIDYDSRPRLRPRLTQGRSALPWKPWIFGREDSHLTLATHSGILSSLPSTAPLGTASPSRQCSSTNPFGFRSFGIMFQPRTFSAQDLSTSELLRTLLMYGCF